MLLEHQHAMTPSLGSLFLCQATLCEELFPDAQPELLLRELYTIPSHLMAGHRRREISTSLSMPPPEVIVRGQLSYSEATTGWKNTSVAHEVQLHTS